MASTTTSVGSVHLVVLVHGLWGNPGHLQFLSDSIRERFADENLHIFLPKSNSGNFTYDGIELGGERVTREIEEKLEELEKRGQNINRMSVIGYSLGGLVARYAIGLLYHKGIFERIQPVNFTTFATPHLGVRTPLTGTTNYIWNVLGPRTLSASGKQLFMVDKFRETGRPLLAVLADPEHVFIRALAQFRHRSLYANVINDKTVTYYTAAISETDPFADMEDLDFHYIDGYAPVVMKDGNPVSRKRRDSHALAPTWATSTSKILKRVPFATFLVLFLPLGVTGFLINSAIQSVRSTQRIRLHEAGKAGIDVGEYRIPLISDMRREVEDMYEEMNSGHGQEYLSGHNQDVESQSASSSQESFEKPKRAHSGFPTLALTSEQFAAIRALNEVGFKRFPVYIHKHRHTHAAIIRRRTGAAFEEGRVVAKHWLDFFEV
ncbi:DUF676-domain-containing protein [Sporormia fimetaria CBS 119925]|uniref:DUF676-domain-containing protein n=1 Tax=Sporormia fimetaria CBS 119925 TaxID=1340428 RepID=A0A6A6VFJ2_9PLEO|nr:DUF676-domain-containing protein [Sporormia fimetaria CBS 119925]